jgi:hypothetical protein
MMFTKVDMQKELSSFLVLYGKQIERLYGVGNGELTDLAAVEASPIWSAVSEMYDYGVSGVPTAHLFPKGHVVAEYGAAERFLRAVDTPHMRLYLKEEGNTPPRLATTAVLTAIARMVLDDGWRQTDYGAEYGILEGDMGILTIAEIALLANMDEGSVRNATNKKLPDPLKTVQLGKRSLVEPEEARRWLAGRKGFVPTKPCDGTQIRPSEYDVRFTEEQVIMIQKLADREGVSCMEYLEKIFATPMNVQKKETETQEKRMQK